MFSAVNAVVVICVHSLIDSIQYDAQLPMADGVVVLLFTEKAKLTIERLGLFIDNNALGVLYIGIGTVLEIP